MMAGFSADQAVLQSEQSLMLVLCEEGCKGREIQVVFCTGWLLQAQNCRTSIAEGHCMTAGWACCSLSGLLPKPADLPPCQEEKLDALLRGLYLLE